MAFIKIKCISHQLDAVYWNQGFISHKLDTWYWKRKFISHMYMKFWRNTLRESREGIITKMRKIVFWYMEYACGVKELSSFQSQTNYKIMLPKNGFCRLPVSRWAVLINSFPKFMDSCTGHSIEAGTLCWLLAAVRTFVKPRAPQPSTYLQCCEYTSAGLLSKTML